MAGVRVGGGRIYDPVNGKTCHQCRHKTRDFVASCKNLKKNNRCTITFCHKCLLNRYGEKAEEVELFDDWRCPKCRGNCNCSFCRKKQGLKPTGLLCYTAKKGGFGSVSEMLTAKGPENFGIEKVVNKEAVDEKENSIDINVEAGLNSVQNPEEGEVRKTKRNGLKEIHNGSRDDPKVSDDGFVEKVKSRKRKNKDRSEEADDAKLQGEEVQDVVTNNDVKRKKKNRDKLKSGIETCRVEECNKDQREEADDAELQGEDVQDFVTHNDVKRKKKLKHKVKSGIETCRVEECNKDQREEAYDAELQGEEVQDVVNNNDVKRKKKKHKDKVKSGIETCKIEECNKDQREEADDTELQGGDVQDFVNHNDVKRKKKHKHKVKSGIETCKIEECNKDQREEADDTELQGGDVQDFVNHNDVKRKKKHKHKVKSGIETCRVEECNKDQREEADDAELQGEEVQDVVTNNDVKRKKKHKHKVKSGIETCRVEECNKDQREEADNAELQGEEVQDVVHNNDVKRKKKKHKDKVKSGIETCKVEECNKDQREEADDAELQGEDVQHVVNHNDVKRKKKHKNKVKSGIETCRVGECNKDQREEADDVKLQDEKVQNVVNNNDVKRKKKNHKDKVKSGIETCRGEECNKDQREEADNAELQGEEVQDVVNNNDVKWKKKKHRDKVKSGIETCRVNESTKIILNKDVEPELPLPEGIPLTSVLGIELLPEDAGNALQFLEFFSAFGEVLNLKRAHAESILGELLRRRSGRTGRPGKYSSVIRFLMQLLSLLQEDMGEEPSSIDDINHNNSWFQDLGKCISDSEAEHLLKELPTDCFSKGAAGYDILNISQKLRLLTYLCDEVIRTSKLRSWIEEQHEKIVESEKEAKGKVNAAKDKEKLLKGKLQDEVAKLIIAKNGAPLSISEHEALVSQIKTEAAQAHAQLLEAEGIMPKKKQRCDALRTEPCRVDVDGRVFWKLKGYNNGEDIVLQDTGSWDAVVSKEEWFVYGVEAKEAIENYCSKEKKVQ